MGTVANISAPSLVLTNGPPHPHIHPIHPCISPICYWARSSKNASLWYPATVGGLDRSLTLTTCAFIAHAANRNSKLPAQIRPTATQPQLTQIIAMARTPATSPTGRPAVGLLLRKNASVWESPD